MYSNAIRTSFVPADPLRDSYLLEHGLKADGRPDPESTADTEGGSFETFFTETNSGKYVPRSIFVDLDPSVRIAWLVSGREIKC